MGGESQMKMIKRLASMLTTGIIIVLLSGCTSNRVPSEVKLHDVHAVAYSEDGTSLYVANPENFLVHQASGWIAQVNAKGFTNVSLTKQGMYLSGQQGAEKQR